MPEPPGTGAEDERTERTAPATPPDTTTTDPGPTAPASLGGQLRRLGRHSAVYGLGGLVSRVIAVFLLPIYTRYLTPSDYGQVETLVAATAVMTIVLRFGISNAFFRFWFDTKDEAHRRTILRTSFWFTMAMATLGLVLLVVFRDQVSTWLFGSDEAGDLVAASGVALWASMNYEQLTAVFRVEERSTAFVIASLTNIAITIGATILLVVVLGQGPLGVIVGNFTGTLSVYFVLLAYRREQLGLELDRHLLRAMNVFGLPFVPTALFLWVTNFSSRIFLVKLADTTEAGLFSVGVRIASAMVLLLTAFRMAWPAFAFSIDDEREARRTYAFVLTYLVAFASWVALGLAAFAPWIVELLTTSAFADAADVVPLLAFAAVAYGGYMVVAIGVGRVKRTQFNWVITGAGAAVNVAINLLLIPRYGMMGAALATLAANVTMFAGMAWWSNRLFPAPYQWRRVATAGGAAAALAAAAVLVGGGLPVAILLVAAYPLLLGLLGFYLPFERRAIAARLRAAR